MNLLLLTADFPPCAWSGIAAAVECQATALASLGVAVHVLTRSPAARRFEPPALDVRSVADATGFPWTRTRFDCIHLHSLGFAELAFEMRRRTGVPLVYTAHSLIERELPGCRRWIALQHAVMQACDAVVFVSDADREAALARLPSLAGVSRVIRNAVPPPSTLREWRASGPIVYAGRFTERKGIDLFAAIARRLRPSWAGRVVVAGGHGDVTGDLAVRRLGEALGDAIDVTGWLTRPALDRLFGSAALVVVPSRYEPFGLVPLEAMRLGAPVLAARTGGLVENVTPESGGRLVDSYEPDAWVRAALTILTVPGEGESLSRRGPQFVMERFHPRTQALALVDRVYRPVVAQAAGSEGAR